MNIDWNNIFDIVSKLHLLESVVSKGYVLKAGSKTSWDLNGLTSIIITLSYENPLE